jgi:hypothetical protein
MVKNKILNAATHRLPLFPFLLKVAGYVFGLEQAMSGTFVLKKSKAYHVGHIWCMQVGIEVNYEKRPNNHRLFFYQSTKLQIAVPDTINFGYHDLKTLMKNIFLVP